jgi:probable F420-dependent oxidoreductase
MKFAINLPLSGLDHLQARDLAQTLDSEGFDLLTIGGHLLASQPGRYPDRPVANYAGEYFEPFVLFSYLAGVTQRISFMNSILILPMLPTALVAKQAADLSLLSGGRYLLGAGISWQEAEYTALGADVHSRGQKLVEQIQLLRRLWTEPFVTFEGKFHKLDGVGLNRLPTSPIPIWLGTGTDDARLRRVAWLADGWIPTADPEEPMSRIRRYLAEAKRDPASFGMISRVVAGPEGPSSWIEAAKRLQGIGATYITVSPPQGQTVIEALPGLIEAKKAIAAALG